MKILKSTKLVCTVGPKSRDEGTLAGMANAGMDIVRINMSHGTHDFHRGTIELTRKVAKQTGRLVVSISQRRNVITLYQGNLRYSLKDIGVILTKANQAIQTLEKYKAVLDQAFINLSAAEIEELVTLQDVTNVIQRLEMVLRVKSEIKRYINELGSEGRLISMQLEELVAGLDQESVLLLKDYSRDYSDEKIREIRYEDLGA